MSSTLSVGHWASTLDWNKQERIELPLNLDNRGRPAVTVQVSGQSFLALIDSGSPVTTISSSAVELLELKTTSKRGSQRLDGWLPIQLGQGYIEVPPALVGQGPGNAQLTLGQEIFAKAVVEMDFESRRLVLHHPKTFAEPTSKAVKVGRHYTRPNVEIALPASESTVCATIDTGFDGGLALPPKLVQELALPDDPTKPDVAYTGFRGRGAQAPALAPLSELAIGGQSLRDVPLIGVVPNENEKCSALLGMAILSRFRLVFDMRNDRIWLLPRK